MAEPNGRKRTDIVFLRYDLSSGQAKRYSSMLLGGDEMEGVWHSSVMVFEREYFFDGMAGIETHDPFTTRFGRPEQTEVIDTTTKTKEEFEAWNEQQTSRGGRFHATEYTWMNNNCNHYAHEAICWLSDSGLGSPDDVVNMIPNMYSSPIAGMMLQLVTGAFGGPIALQNMQLPAGFGPVLPKPDPRARGFEEGERKRRSRLGGAPYREPPRPSSGAGSPPRINASVSHGQTPQGSSSASSNTAHSKGGRAKIVVQEVVDDIGDEPAEASSGNRQRSASSARDDDGIEDVPVPVSMYGSNICLHAEPPTGQMDYHAVVAAVRQSIRYHTEDHDTRQEYSFILDHVSWFSLLLRNVLQDAGSAAGVGRGMEGSINLPTDVPRVASMLAWQAPSPASSSHHAPSTAVHGGAAWLAGIGYRWDVCVPQSPPPLAPALTVTRLHVSPRYINQNVEALQALLRELQTMADDLAVIATVVEESARDVVDSALSEPERCEPAVATFNESGESSFAASHIPALRPRQHFRDDLWSPAVTAASALERLARIPGCDTTAGEVDSFVAEIRLTETDEQTTTYFEPKYARGGSAADLDGCAPILVVHDFARNYHAALDDPVGDGRAGTDGQANNWRIVGESHVPCSAPAATTAPYAPWYLLHPAVTAVVYFSHYPISPPPRQWIRAAKTAGVAIH